MTFFREGREGGEGGLRGFSTGEEGVFWRSQSHSQQQLGGPFDRIPLCCRSCVWLCAWLWVSVSATESAGPAKFAQLGVLASHCVDN